MPDGTDIFETMRLELRRGSLVLAVLACLRTERYGYSLRQALATDGLEMEESTLYPLLRRLEKQGHLTSEWNTDEARPRKFYRTSPTGDALARILTDDWHRLDDAVARLTNGDPR